MERYSLNKIYEVRAQGGPAKAYTKKDDPFRRTPTHPGRFQVEIIGEHLTSEKYNRWSNVPWLTPIRIIQDVVYLAIKGNAVRLSEINNYYKRIAAKGGEKFLTEVFLAACKKYFNDDNPRFWTYNDFGHITVKYFRDRNHNGKRDKGERLMGDMIHSTNQDEVRNIMGNYAPYNQSPYDFRPLLEESHGCIHLGPSDLDYLIAQGYFRKGSTLVVHPYEDEEVRDVLPRDHAKPPFEAHFYPGLKQPKLVIYRVSTNTFTHMSRDHSRVVHVPFH